MRRFGIVKQDLTQIRLFHTHTVATSERTRKYGRKSHKIAEKSDLELTGLSNVVPHGEALEIRILNSALHDVSD